MKNYGLNSETKKSVKATVLFLRALLEGEFHPDTGEPIPPGGDIARQIARYGIQVNKPESLKNESAPEYLTDEEKKKRERICAAIRREVAIFGKLSDKAALRRAVRAFIRQTSYTWINRLLGLRCMESRELLKDDRGELDFVVTPSDDYGGLPRRAWRIKGADPAKWQSAKVYDLQCEAIADACRQLTLEIKVLFDPEHDYGLIWPSPPALNTLLQKIQELDGIATPSPFTSPDFLGWVYQYFQTIEKDLVFKAASKKKRKIEKDDIIPATQIFTEHYMVEYLVQNSLGRFWMEMHPDSRLSDKWAYYVTPPEENPVVERKLKKAIEIKMIDPALGSGHFHLVSFDILLDMYQEEIQHAGQPGWPETPSVKDKNDIPKAILENNLFGIDIDARAVQIASLVLVMKARESGYEGPIDHLNLVVANSAPFESEAWHQFVQNLKEEGKHSVARVLAALGIQLKNLDEFGSLLRIEDEMQKIIQEEKNKWVSQAGRAPEQDYLFPEMTKPIQERLPFEKAITDETFFDRLGAVIQNELDDFYQRARDEGLAEEAIMAADAERGFDFARLSMLRYDVVYTNPPYMGSGNMGQRLKRFVTTAYPQGKRDLYAAFILRCLQLAQTNSYVGMVTQQSWIYKKDFDSLRGEKKGNGLLNNSIVESLADLGPRAFADISGEVVSTVLTVIRDSVPESAHRYRAFRLVDIKPARKKEEVIKNLIKCGELGARMFEPKQQDCHLIERSPLIYWLTDRLREILTNGPFVRDIAKPVVGLQTGDAPRYIRFFWELNSDPLCLPYVQGGGYCKWYGLDNSEIYWQDGGVDFKASPSARWNGADYFGVRGLTYSESSQGSLSFRIIDGHGFSQAGSAVFPKEPSMLSGLAAVMCSRIISYFSRILRPGIVFPAGYVGLLPVPCPIESFNQIADSCISIKEDIVSNDLTERCFSSSEFQDGVFGSPVTSLLNESLLLLLEGLIEHHIFSVSELKAADKEAILSETGMPPAWFPLVLGYDNLPEPHGLLAQLLGEVRAFICNCKRIALSLEQMDDLKLSLKMEYEAGSGRNLGVSESNAESMYEDVMGFPPIAASIPIPAETFLEELSRKFLIHPISLYWLIKEMREKDELRCPPEEKRHAEDHATVMILRMLGYQWPKQVEVGEPLPEWADDDGIIPLTEGLGEPTLLDRVRERFGADFGEEKEASTEAEFSNIVGKSLERWLEEDFFARHAKQFKKRPIAWHIVSDPSSVNHEAGQGGKGKKKRGKKKQKPAFSVMIHYHCFVDGDKGYGKLLLLKNKYLEKLMSQTRSELESLRGKSDDPEAFDRMADLDRKLVELEDFRGKLERIQEGKDRESRVFVRWKSAEEQPRGWRPDINDGVKINIAPWERLGMFPIKKIVGNVEMAPE
jgi:hypothetical protein